VDHGDETVADRLRLTLELWEFGVELKAAQLRGAHPGASEAEIERMVQVWLGERPGAEHGDGVGVPVPLDRFR
jgi:hypothetical protein